MAFLKPSTHRHCAMLSSKVAFAAKHFAFLAIALCIAFVPLAAQNRAGGEIRGTVMDPSGAVVPGVAVRILNTGTGVVTNLTTNGSGIYDAVSLVPGPYTISFAKTGFRELVKTNIILTVETITQNATLQVGTVTQQVQVRTGVQLLKTESSDRGGTLTESSLAQLPSVSRNWFNYTFLLAGANGAQGRGGSGLNANNFNGNDVGFNGQGGYQSLALMDGGNATMLPAQNSEVIPLQAIAEVQIKQSNFSAEYGNALSTFNVIMKSGTNQFHGELFEYVQNNAFQARNFFSPSTPPLRWNQYGGAIGGPIKRDKLFFFFSFQNNPIRGYTTGITTYPTAAMRAGDLAGLPQVYDPKTLAPNANGTFSRAPFAGNLIPASRISSSSAKIMGFYPMPNLPGDVNNTYYAVSDPSSAKNYDWRVDYNISSGNRLSASMNYLDYNSFSPNVGPTCSESIDCISSSIHMQTDVISDVWSITPTTVNEFRSSLQRSYQPYIADDVGKDWGSTLGIAQLTAPTFPGITVGGTGAPHSIGTSFKHARLGYSTIAEADTLTMIKGRHILKFGGEFDANRENLAWGDINAGDFNFSGQFTNDPQNPSATGMGFADFLLGVPNTWSNGWTPAWGDRIRDFQAFAQDDYKLRPNLTLNLGLRWLAQTGYTEQYNRLGSFDPKLANPATGRLGAMWYGGQNGRRALQATIWDNFEPRIGFAWSLRPNWVVRGGYGIFDNMWGGDTFQAGVGTGIAVSGFDYAQQPLVPFMQLAAGHAPPAIPTFPPSAAFYNGSGVTYVPYNQPQPYIQNWNLGVQHQLKGDMMVGVSYVGARGVKLADPSSYNQVPETAIQQHGGIGVNMQPYRPYPQYTGITLQSFGGWSSYNALQITFEKHFSHGLMVQSNYTWSHSLDTNTQNGWAGPESDYQIAMNPSLLYGNSQVDQRHAWNGAFVYQLPFGEGKPFLNKGGILNGFLGGWQVSNMWTVLSGMPFSPTWGGQNLSFSGAGAWYPNRVCNGSLSDPTIDKWFNTSCFESAAPGTYGNSGRNIVFGPHYVDMDSSLAKSFKISPLGEAASLQIRVDASDVLNHPNFGLPSSGVTPPPTTAGTIRSSLSQRNLQLGARLVF